MKNPNANDEHSRRKDELGISPHEISVLESMTENSELLFKVACEHMLNEVHMWKLIRNSEGEISNWRLLAANAAALKNWGLTLEEVRGKTAEEVFPNSDAVNIFMPIVKKIFKEQKSEVWEKDFPATNQTLHMISIPCGENFVSCGIDVSRIRQTEKKLYETTKELENATNSVKKALLATVKAIALTVERRDPYTAGHMSRVAELAVAVAQKLGLSEWESEGIQIAATIFDLGKIQIPSEILNAPRKLSVIEFGLVKPHSQLGYDIIKEIEFPWPVADMVLSHHERLDGSGYPHGLKGDEIILGAQILGALDVLEAVSSHRPYRPALGLEKGLEILKEGKNTLYNSEVVDACVSLIEVDKFEFSTVF